MNSLDFFDVIETTSNTDDWLKKRKGKVGISIGSSAIGAAAGISMFKTRNEVVHDLLYGSSFKGNEATEHGHKYEEMCANCWSERYETDTHEVGICCPTPDNPFFNDKDQPGYPYFGVSIDRWACIKCNNSSKDIRQHTKCKGFRVIECKCPFSKRSFNAYYNMKIKDEHLAQLHLQMAVLGLREIEYMVALISPDGCIEEERLATVHFSREFWDFIYPRAFEVVLTVLEASFKDQPPVELDQPGLLPPKVRVVWK